MSEAQSDAPQNRPGQPALAYRVTTHEESLSRMLARLPESTIPSGPHQGTRPLAALTTRAETDPALALLHGWASVLDVLTFYQERILNEGFLRTATEPLSLRELAQTVGYRPAPATAAVTYLAFTVDSLPGLPTRVTVPVGTRALSMPPPGGLPQTFETTAATQARLEWNKLVPRLHRPQTLVTSSDGAAGTVVNKLRLQTQASGLRESDLLLICGTTTVRVTSITPKAAEKYTEVGFEVVSGPAVRLAPWSVPTGDPRELPAGLGSDGDKGALASYLLARAWDDTDLAVILAARGLTDIELSAQAAAAQAAATVPQVVLAFRQRSQLFGADASTYNSLAKISTSFTRGSTDLYDLSKYPDASWDDPVTLANTRLVWQDSWKKRYSAGPSGSDLFLIRSIPTLRPGSMVLLVSPRGAAAYTLASTVETTVHGYGTLALTTGLTLTSRPSDAALAADPFLTRDTIAHVQSEALPLCATVPLAGLDDTPVQDQVLLAGFVPGLAAGQPVALSGELTNQPGVSRTEIVSLAGVRHVGGYTALILDPPLLPGFRRETVSLCANLAPASHGETVSSEILGSGDAGQVNQRFSLRRSPLTYLAAATALGYRSTLSVRVNGVEWREVESLLDASPDSPVFTIERGAEGQAAVVFGDGVHGARLPSGDSNVTATYRTGSGPAGEVEAHSIKLLISGPSGLRELRNPVAATGSAAAAASDAIRDLVPRSVSTLGRAVALDDYEGLARAYSGVAKAQATAVQLASVPGVHLTVAGSNGASFARGSLLHKNLLATLLALGNPSQPLIVDAYRPRFFRLSARLVIDPTYEKAAVRARAAAALTTAFGFEARGFAQPVRSAEVLYVMQRVPGVLGVLLDSLDYVPPPGQTSPPGPPRKLPLLAAEPARVTPLGESAGAELLLLSLGDEDLRTTP